MGSLVETVKLLGGPLDRNIYAMESPCSKIMFLVLWPPLSAMWLDDEETWPKGQYGNPMVKDGEGNWVEQKLLNVLYERGEKQGGEVQYHYKGTQ